MRSKIVHLWCSIDFWEHCPDGPAREETQEYDVGCFQSVCVFLLRIINQSLRQLPEVVNGQGHEIKNCSFVMFHWLLGTLSWWTCQRRNSGIRRGVFSKRMHFFITYNQSIIKATSRSGGKGMEHPGCILFYKLHTYRPSLSSHNIFLPITWDIKFHFDNIMTMTNFRHNSSIVAPMLLGCERSD